MTLLPGTRSFGLTRADLEANLRQRVGPAGHKLLKMSFNTSNPVFLT